MEVPEGWTSKNKRGAEESLTWTIETRLDKIQIGVQLDVWGQGGNSDSFDVSIDGGSKKTVNHHSYYWKWSPMVTFFLAKAGKHTLKVHLREDGSKISAVKLVPLTTGEDLNPVWFAQTDPESFTSGILQHDKTGKCMVCTEYMWAAYVD